jgi:hypothetical protein
MKFARILFCCAGAWGFLVLTPMYFMYSKIGKYSPPTPTHPELYYGFAGVTLAWQLAFFVIASDPERFRTMIIPSAVEKLSYVIAVVVLYAQSRITAVQLSTGAPDALLCVLFGIAFFKTRPGPLAGVRKVDHRRR